MAFSATIVAGKLWFKLLMSILIPTTEHSLVYAKEGWTALEPSLRQSAFWFAFETSLTFKLGVFATILGLILIWLLEREIKRRRIFERIQARVDQIMSRVNAIKQATQERYASIKAEIERESRIAAQILPHFLFLIFSIGIIILFPDILFQLSRGFFAWSVIVGWPMIISIRHLLKLDEIRRTKLKKINPNDETLSSNSSSDDEEEEEEEPVEESSKQQQQGPKQKKTS